MSIKKTSLLEAIDEMAPESLAEAWDNCGMQLDLGFDQVEKLLTCLEITDAVIEEAAAEHCDFILTHHPLLFHAIKKIDAKDVVGGYLLKLAANGISVYSAHTSFDTAAGGNNDYLAEALGLTDISGLETGGKDPQRGRAMGRVGRLPYPMPLREVAALVAEKIHCVGGVRVAGEANRMISKIGLCTGGAGEFFTDAAACGCDLYISGDVRHHEAQQAKEMGICLIDAGHFGTEQSFGINAAQQLRKKFGDKLPVLVSKTDVNPYSFMI